ncbi:MAG TPA: arylesterase [Marinobacter sp.]|nr:arylesterase [Marinobacter sp.]
MHTITAFIRSLILIALALITLPVSASSGTLLVLGDSLSAAYGIPSEDAWVELLRKRLSDQGLDWQVVNASISGETTDGGLRRLPGLLESSQPAIVVIELGGNDGLRGFPPNVIESNLAQMIELSQQAGARPLLVGMQIPPNYGSRYTRMFASVFPALSDRYDIPLVPFFLDGIYNQEGLMQDDDIHPTADAQPHLLDNLWPLLEPLVQ